MKQTVTMTQFTDDLDGGKAQGTVRFAYDGVEMEIDLSSKNKSAMEKAFKPYVDAGRKVRATRAPRTKRASSNGASNRRSDLAVIRDWANANGMPVSGRGRIAADVVAAYEATK
jgi:hypothetical protein